MQMEVKVNGKTSTQIVAEINKPKNSVKIPASIIPLFYSYKVAQVPNK